MNTEAKALFFRYAGNRGLMHRDGVLAEYEHFNVPRSTEHDWTHELQATLLDSFKTHPIADRNFHLLLDSLAASPSFENTLSLLETLQAEDKHVDTFTKVIATEFAMDLLASLNRKKAIGAPKLAALQESLRHIIRGLTSGKPITVDAYYESTVITGEALGKAAINQRIRAIEHRAREAK